jgi:hypothetical protein
MTTEKLHLIAGPVNINGDVARVVELPNGAGRIEHWERGIGWVAAPAGSFRPDQFVPGAYIPVTAATAARLGIPACELELHWTDRLPEVRAGRAKIVGLVMERAWDLACHRMAPGHA